MKKSLALASAAVLAVPVMLAPMLAAGPAGAATQNRVVGWVSCDMGAMGMLTVQPVRHVLSCADHNSGLRKLTWSSWTSRTATGAGVYYWNDCTPDCAAGTTEVIAS